MSNDFKDTLSFIKKTIDKKEESQQNLYIAPNAELIDKFLYSESNNRTVDEFLIETKEKYTFELNPVISDKESIELLSSLKNKYDSERLMILVDDCKSSVIDSIIKPFGLAGVLFEDRIGGNVTTIHNFEKNIAATKEDAERANEWYEKYGKDVPESERVKFSRKDYEKEYQKKRDTIVDRNKANGNIDSYTDYEIEGGFNVDHVVSEHEIDMNSRANLFLSKDERAKMANDDSNLKPTSNSINSSKQDKCMDDFLKAQATGAPKGVTNSEKYGINEEKARKGDNESRDQIIKTLRNAQIKTQGKELLETGMKEGFKMGTQQAIGLLVREFTLAAFSEAKDIFSNRHTIILNSEFLHSLKERFERISKRVMSKWKDVVAVFGHGAISGFFSNLITVIINSFLTTSKRAVKMIREGFYSLLKALKILMSPPQNISRVEAAHEATKLIASGLIVTGGIAVEELLQKSLASIPVFGMFSDIIATVIVGIVTGLSMAFIVYLVDKIDLFKVNANKCKEYISHVLNEIIDVDIEEYEDAYNYIACTLDI